MRKLESYLFYIFLFSLPISFRHIFNYESFYFIEWKAISLYATDILLASLLGFWIYSRKPIKFAWPEYLLLAFLAFVGLSIFNADYKMVAWYQFIKLIEGAVLYFYIKDYALNNFSLANCFKALVTGALFQSIVAIIQFITQHSLGLKYLGESVLAPNMTNIAAFYVNGVKVMRAYGTLPHPNVLAAYLFIASGAFLYLAIYKPIKWWWYLADAVILWALLTTFSRVVIALWGLNMLIRAILIYFHPVFRRQFWDKPEVRKRCLIIIGIAIAVCALFAAIYWPYVINRVAVSGSDEAVQLRVFYNHESLAGGYKWLGLGIGNFVPWLMTQNLHLGLSIYQPVHNIYLLIYSETGILATVLFIAFILLLIFNFWRYYRFTHLFHFSFMLIVCSVLLMGLADHFLWTIQSGRFILWLSLAFLTIRSNSANIDTRT